MSFAVGICKRYLNPSRVHLQVRSKMYILELFLLPFDIRHSIANLYSILCLHKIKAAPGAKA
jgi:hypothetical protein